MNYQEKYIKYKTKYLQLGGSTIINFADSVKIYKKVVENATNLEKTYAGFWKNIYYNDAYVFYKNAIEYYKNIQNSKFHGFFSVIINKKLFTGSCQYIDGAARTDFPSNKDIKKIDLDDLCNLSVQVINILDTVFLNCPTIPYDIVAYRQEFRENNDRIFALKKGDYYKNAGYMSTSINPWYLFSKTEYYESNDIDISMTIYMPKNTKGYYMLHPFGIYYDKSIKKNVGLQEYEILLPRNNIFEVLETKFVGNRFFIKLLLKHQMIPKEHPVSIETSKIQPNYFSTKEYKQLDKSKYEELGANIKNFVKDNTKINIYNGYRIINKNKYPFKMDIYELFSRYLSVIDNIYIISWLDKKPTYDKKKYGFIPKEKFDNVYTQFMDSIPLMKKKKNVYIIVSLLYLQNNHLYGTIINNLEVNKKIKIKKPLFIDETLTNSIFAQAVIFVTTGDDKNMLATNIIDTNYPMTIIIKYKKTMEYIPMYSDIGFAFNVTELKFEKIDQIYITDELFYYYVEAS